MKLLERLMDIVPGLRRVRAEQARRDDRVDAQQRHAEQLEERATKTVRRVSARNDRIAREMRAVDRAFHQ